ncbi:MAG TPA: zf-HC2 domain-containing protein [Kofleriaceae bacterium]|jgi:hypothetical protein|nr:zf-HC2 domain-containing protein [Kofleriaceae bacterium]
MSCRTPLDDARLVAYWAGDLAPADADAVEEHLFGCDACTAASTRVAQIAAALRGQLPPVISCADLDVLRGKGLTLVENAIPPGVRTEVTFARHVDLMIHRLGGLALTGADRVQVIIRVESTGDVMFDEPFAPYDAERGEVLVACQRHYAVFPRDIEIEVRAHRAGAPPAATVYAIPHVFG